MAAMRLLMVGCAAATLAAVASASAANPVRATLTTSSAHPVVGLPWRYTVAVKDDGGQPLAARVRLQIVRGPIVIGCRMRTAVVRCSGARAGTWIPFAGRHLGAFAWPSFAVGPRLAFRAIVVRDAQALRLRAPVSVRAAP